METKNVLLAACRAVDRDIEQSGAVSAETVDLVRAALALVESQRELAKFREREAAQSKTIRGNDAKEN